MVKFFAPKTPAFRLGFFLYGKAILMKTKNYFGNAEAAFSNAARGALENAPSTITALFS